MPIKLNSTGGGSVTLDVGSTASNYTVTLPATSGTLMPIAAVTNNGVVYVNSSGSVTSGSGLVFDGANMGVGTSSPGTQLDVNNGSANVTIRGRTGSGYSSTLSLLPNGSGSGVALSANSDNSAILFNNLNSYLGFGTNSAERMRIDSSGNIGVGTTGPAYKLDVVGVARAAEFIAYGGGGEGGQIVLRNVANTDTGLLLDVDSINNARFYNAQATNTIFYTSAAERMRITAAGYVGIGTSSPPYLATISGPSGSCILGLIETGVRSWGIRSGGVGSNYFDIADFTAGQVRFSISPNGRVTIGTATQDTYKLSVDGDIRATVNFRCAGGDGIYIDSYNTVSASVFASNLATSNPNWLTCQLQTVHFSGSWAGYRMGCVNGQNFDFQSSGGSAYAPGSWVNGSDGRVKINRQIIENALDKVGQLTGYVYERTDLQDIQGNNKIGVGLIAQDVREVLPEAVEIGMEPPKEDPDGEGFLSLNYNAIIGLLVNAVNDLKAELDELKAKVNV